MFPASRGKPAQFEKYRLALFIERIRKKDGELGALDVYSRVGRADGMKVPAHSFYVNCQHRTRPGWNGPGEKIEHDRLDRS